MLWRRLSILLKSKGLCQTNLHHRLNAVMISINSPTAAPSLSYVREEAAAVLKTIRYSISHSVLNWMKSIASISEPATSILYTKTT